MSTVRRYQHKCCMCRKEQTGSAEADMSWIHPVCAHIVCHNCQSLDKMKTSRQPCPDTSRCLYHSEANATELKCRWPSSTPLESLLPAFALPVIMSHQSSPLIEQKMEVTTNDADPITNLPPSSPTPPEGCSSGQDNVNPRFYELCGNCHKQGEMYRIIAIDLECLIGMCVFCFGSLKGHESHARDKVLRLLDKETIKGDLIKRFIHALTSEVVKRLEPDYYTEMITQTNHQQQQGDESIMGEEEGKALKVDVKPITQSFFERMTQLKQCGSALLPMYHDLQHAYHEMLLKIETSGKTMDSSITSSSSSLLPTHTETISTYSNNKLVQFLQVEGKHRVEDVLSRLEGMVSQRIILTDTFDCLIKLLGLPSNTLSNELEGGRGGKAEGGDDMTRLTIQSAFEKLDLTCPQSASKAVMIVRVLNGIRSVIDGGDISLELDSDGLEVLGLKEGVKELIMIYQSISQQLQSSMGDDDGNGDDDTRIETTKRNFTNTCDKVNKMMTIEAVYTAMEQVMIKIGAEEHVKEGLQYMFGEGGKEYSGAKALTAFDLAITKGSKEAMFRKAQLLFDGREGVPRDVTLAVKLFEELKKERLYLPYIYYYLSKHVLERSLGRTAETYKLVSEYFSKILEMKYDDDDDEEEEEGKEEEEVEKGKGMVEGRSDDRKLDIERNGISEVEGKDSESRREKASILFAQAGLCYLHALMDESARPYFRRQLPIHIRRWLKECNMYKLCKQAIKAGCKEPEMYCMMGYAYFLGYPKDEGEGEGGGKEEEKDDKGVGAGREGEEEEEEGEEGKKEGKEQVDKEGDSEERKDDDKGKEGIKDRDDDNEDEEEGNERSMCKEENSKQEKGKGNDDDKGKDGNIVNKDDTCREGLDYLSKACQLGITAAYHILGWAYSGLYMDSLGFLKDTKKALFYYLEAEKKGYSYGGYLYTDIAYLYWYRNCKDSDDGDEKDDNQVEDIDDKKDGERVLYYFDLGIKYGDEVAYYLKAQIYNPKTPTCPSIEKCVDTCYRLKKEAERAGCMYPLLFIDLAADYTFGQGVYVGAKESLEYYKKAIKTGSTSRLYWIIGRLYDTRINSKGLKKNDKKAMKYYMKEISMRRNDDGEDLEPVDPEVYMRIGRMYEEGRGTVRDYNIAVEYYEKAQGQEAYALGRLGVLYDTAQTNIPYDSKDDEKARKRYKGAIKLDPDSIEPTVYLGNMYRDGRGGEMDGVKAMACYKKACDLGHYEVLYEEALIYDPEKKECSPIEKDEQRAVELYLAAKGANVQTRELMTALAECYRRGRCMKKDEDMANHYDSLAQQL